MYWLSKMTGAIGAGPRCVSSGSNAIVLPSPWPTTGDSVQIRRPGTTSAKRPEPLSPARPCTSPMSPSFGKNDL